MISELQGLEMIDRPTDEDRARMSVLRSKRDAGPSRHNIIYTGRAKRKLPTINEELNRIGRIFKNEA